VSPVTRFGAVDVNTTAPPSALMTGNVLAPVASVPLVLTLTRSVVPVLRSRTNTSVAPFVSPGTRLVASEAKATSWPSALMDG
jgi:hypothetical protein